MKNLFLSLIITSLLISLSCNDREKKQLIKNWKVTKMEKIVKTMSNSYIYVNIEKNPNMSYHFMTDNKVRISTKYGSNLIGNWHRNDSLITIKVKKEKKEFKIITLTDKNLIMVSDKFKFHLENKKNNYTSKNEE